MKHPLFTLSIALGLSLALSSTAFAAGTCPATSSFGNPQRYASVTRFENFVQQYVADLKTINPDILPVITPRILNVQPRKTGVIVRGMLGPNCRVLSVLTWNEHTVGRVGGAVLAEITGAPSLIDLANFWYAAVKLFR